MLRVSPDVRDQLIGESGELLRMELRSLAHGASSTQPAVRVALDPEGLYVCDDLGDRARAEQVLERAIKLLLRVAESVTIEEL